jgi:hypothetical protein
MKTALKYLGGNRRGHHANSQNNNEKSAPSKE